MTELLLYLYAESPVHAGGADSLGALDLPIQREASTGYPVIWGQSLKGALRQAAIEKLSPDLVVDLFGSAIGDGRDEVIADADDMRGASTAGHLVVGDAQLVAMPIPTLRRTFAWVTSEIALTRLARKYRNLSATIPTVPRVGHDRGAAASAVWLDVNGTRSEILGPCLVPLGTEVNTDLARWSGRLSRDVLGGGDISFGQMADKLRDDLLLVDSSIMPMLLKECTEFVARVQLGAGKTVENGPFYSEYLPTETIMACSLSLRRSRQDDARTVDRLAGLQTLLDEKLITVGGDETIGKGMIWTRLLDAGTAAADPSPVGADR